jgi:hypothetical protein
MMASNMMRRKLALIVSYACPLRRFSLPARVGFDHGIYDLEIVRERDGGGPSPWGGL